MSNWKDNSPVVKAEATTSSWKDKSPVVAGAEEESHSKDSGGSSLKDLALSAIDKYQRYIADPAQAAGKSLQDDGGFPTKRNIGKAVMAGLSQMGQPHETAPTSEDLLKGDKLTAQVYNPKVQGFLAKGFIGGAMDLEGPPELRDEATQNRAEALVRKAIPVAAEATQGLLNDPGSYVGAGEIKSILGGAGSGLIKGAEKIGPRVGAVTKKAVESIPKGIAYGLEQTTGKPKALWENYMKRFGEVGELSNKFQGDTRYLDAFKDYRQDLSGAIESRKGDLNQMITEGLGASSKEKNIPVEPLLEGLEQKVAALHPETQADAVAQIRELQDMVNKVAPDKKMSEWDAYNLQRWFHERSQGAFKKSGQIFSPASEASKAARGTRYDLTKTVNERFPDTISKANKEFVDLHNINDVINKNMIDPEGSTAAMTRAATDPSSKEAESLRHLGKFLYGDENRILQEVKDLVTFKEMTSLPVNPVSGLGTTSTSRTLVGGAIGAGGGYKAETPEGKIAAGLLGASIASPAMAKLMLDAGLKSKGLLQKGLSGAKGLVGKGLPGAAEFIKDEEGAFKPDELLKMLRKDGSYDLKKARETAGPAKGLLPGEKGNPAGAFPEVWFDDSQKSKMGPVKMTWDKASETDRTLLKQLTNKVENGEALSREERNFLGSLEQKWVKDEGVRKEVSNINLKSRNIEDMAAAKKADGGELRSAANPEEFSTVVGTDDRIGDVVNIKGKDHVITYVDRGGRALVKPVNPEPRGLLTSLDMEQPTTREAVSKRKSDARDDMYSRIYSEKYSNAKKPQADPDDLKKLARAKQLRSQLQEYGKANPDYTMETLPKEIKDSLKENANVKRVRYGTPNGNTWVATVQLPGSNKTFSGAGRTGDAAVENVFAGGSNHLVGDAKELMSGNKPTELIVGSQNYLRQRLPFFLLQQNDIHLLNHGDEIGVLGMSRQGGPAKYVTGPNIDEALDNFVAQFKPAEEAPAVSSSAGGDKSDVWLQRWLYSQKKQSLKDALDGSISPVTRPLPPAEPGPRPPKKPLRDPKKKPEKPKK